MTLVDRRGIGEETSFGNAGVIEREGLVPVGIPRDLVRLFRYAAQSGAGGELSPLVSAEDRAVAVASVRGDRSRGYRGFRARHRHALAPPFPNTADRGGGGRHRSVSRDRMGPAHRTAEFARDADLQWSWRRGSGIEYRRLDPEYAAGARADLKPVLHAGVLWLETQTVAWAGGGDQGLWRASSRRSAGTFRAGRRAVAAAGQAPG